MISITAEIMGPGIEEEYDDLLQRIDFIEPAVKQFPASNDTREGRLVYQLAWLRQEIEGKRLPIPIARKYWSTLGNLVAERSLTHLGIGKYLGELTEILNGTGMFKPRHLPVVIAMLEDFVAGVTTSPSAIAPLEPAEQQMVDDARRIHRGLQTGGLSLPLKVDAYPAWRGTPGGRNFRETPFFFSVRIDLFGVLFYQSRPSACSKGPLPAPNPGMVWGEDI